MKFNSVFKGFVVSLVIMTMPSIFAQSQPDIFIRLNQLGYMEKDQKVAMVFSNNPIKGTFKIFNAENNTEILQGKPEELKEKD